MEEISVCLKREGYTSESTKGFINSLLEDSLKKESSNSSNNLESSSKGTGATSVSLSFEDF